MSLGKLSHRLSKTTQKYLGPPIKLDFSQRLPVEDPGTVIAQRRDARRRGANGPMQSS